MPTLAPFRRRTRSLLFAAATVGCVSVTEAQSFVGGRLRLGGELRGTIAPEDQGYFNYSNYQTDNLRLLRLDLAAEARLLRGAALLADVRSDNAGVPRVYALYLRASPWPERAFDVQAGLVPPVFGTYPRRRYAAESFLPGVPLAYQYLTDLRPDAIPATAEELVANRGRGWLLRYPVGATNSAPGLPLVDGERWDAGVEVRIGREPLSFAAALTQGSPSRPRIEDDNGGKQVSGRVAFQPVPWLVAGVSAATAEFLSRQATAGLAPPRRGRQDVVGADLEWSRGYWIVRGEAILCRFTLPALLPTRIEAPLTAFGGYAEARYKLRPGLFAAARLERLAFGSIDSTLGRRSWDAPVSRLEVGAGYAPRRHVWLKTAWQHNRRDGGRVRGNDLLVAELALWF